MLGDMLGENLLPDASRIDIQFKESKHTPYSRPDNDRASLGPILRKDIIAESMHGLNIPTTRSLAVVTTGEDVIR